jgi:hypothetical protein
MAFVLTEIKAEDITTWQATTTLYPQNKKSLQDNFIPFFFCSNPHCFHYQLLKDVQYEGLRKPFIVKVKGRGEGVGDYFLSTGKQGKEVNLSRKYVL